MADIATNLLVNPPNFGEINQAGYPDLTFGAEPGQDDLLKSRQIMPYHAVQSTDFEAIAERLIRISHNHPLVPDTFVPWEDEPEEQTLFLPDTLISLHGHPLWATLSRSQQVELGRLEVTQVMSSYAWSETLACLFFTRYLLGLNPRSVEHRFLTRLIIEEFRHQDMFGRAILKLDRIPLPQKRLHRWLAHATVQWLPSSLVFMAVLAIELVADAYARHIRRDERVYSVLRRSSELHHIEEGRHIAYTTAWLKSVTDRPGPITASLYSLVILLQVYFLRSLYVRREFFDRLGVDNPRRYHRAASRHYARKFAHLALPACIDLVRSFNGFNVVTRFFWKRLLNVHA